MVSVTNVVKVSKRRHGQHHVTARNAFPLLEFEINPHGMIIWFSVDYITFAQYHHECLSVLSHKGEVPIIKMEI